MNTNLDTIAQDLYGKISVRFDNIKIGDETGEVLSKKTDIPKARFFEFEYKEHGDDLGTITRKEVCDNPKAKAAIQQEWGSSS